MLEAVDPLVLQVLLVADAGHAGVAGVHQVVAPVGQAAVLGLVGRRVHVPAVLEVGQPLVQVLKDDIFIVEAGTAELLVQQDQEAGEEQAAAGLHGGGIWMRELWRKY